MDILATLAAAGIKNAVLVGSRVTCDPAPTDTDQDVLVLAEKNNFDDIYEWAADTGYVLDGSEVEDYLALTPTDSFQSLSNGEYNLIVTEDPAFFRKFLAATGVAQKLNLLEKSDRIMLFQAVLYGNAPEGFQASGTCPAPIDL